MEGVMMKNKDEYAVAVRKPNNEIAVEKGTHKDFSDKVKLFKLPIFRGMLAFVDSMVIGVKVLNFSASFFEEEEENQAQKDKKKKAKKDKKQDDDFEMEELSAARSETDNQDKTVLDTVALENDENDKKDIDKKDNALLMVFAVLFSIVLSIALFMVLPVFITNLFSSFVTNKILIAFIEGIIRLSIFIGYVVLASRMNEIKRVFMYHGAEHKTINCLENGFELTVENVRWQSKQHKRCGTSFMLLVILISLVFFMIVPVSGLFWRVVSRVLLVPFIAGVSYEFIRLAGRSESKIMDVLSQPGLWMQGLTTKEPDDTMIEVAIQSVGTVFDWRAFLESSAAEDKKTNKSVNGKNAAAKQQSAGKQTAVIKQSTGKQQNSGKQQSSSQQQNTGKQQSTGQQQSTGKQQSTGQQQNTGKQQSTGHQQNAGKQQNSGLQQNTGKQQNAVKQTQEVKSKEITKDESKKQDTPAKSEATGKTTPASTPKDTSNRNPGIPPVNFKSVASNRHEEEEDDEILKALDKFFDGSKDAGKAGEA